MAMIYDSNPYFGTGLDGLNAKPMNTDVAAVKALLSLCPVAAATPLHDLKDLAASIGVAGVSVKDERGRMGMGSFKALGAAFVIAREAAAIRKNHPERDWQEALKGRVFVTASAGNHGLSVVAGARVFGAAAVIYLSETVPASFAERLRGMGAQVVIEGADYEASMAAAEAGATAEGWTLLSDSTWPGHDGGIGVMQGYLIAADEAAEASAKPPSHIFLQAGVGGFAAAMAVHLRAVFGAGPRIIVVEPDRAPALKEALAQGQLCDAGEGVSAMGRLDCKRASLTALSSLSLTANDFATLTDDDVEAELPAMATAGIATSPSGGAGLAGAMIAARHGLFGMTENSHVLCFVTEGPIDEPA